jgi:hypothetical protein
MTIPSFVLSVLGVVDSIFVSKLTGCSPNTLDFAAGTTIFLTVGIFTVIGATLLGFDGKLVLHLIIFTLGV